MELLFLTLEQGVSVKPCFWQVARVCKSGFEDGPRWPKLKLKPKAPGVRTANSDSEGFKASRPKDVKKQIKNRKAKTKLPKSHKKRKGPSLCRVKPAAKKELGERLPQRRHCPGTINHGICYEVLGQIWETLREFEGVWESLREFERV